MRYLLGLALAIVSFGLFAGILEDDRIFERGDANSDGNVDGADITRISNWLFNGGAAPACLNQADANNDGGVNIADCSYLANYLYQGGPAPPYPGPSASVCTTDDAPRPGCENLICP